MDEKVDSPGEPIKNMPKQLLLEVTLLALHFGWTEHEILSLPSIRRQTYVELLSEMCGGFEQALLMGATNRVGMEKLVMEQLKQHWDLRVERMKEGAAGEESDT
jgi:hypothetical protein